MFDERLYRKMNEGIQPDPALVEKTLIAAGKPPRRLPLRAVRRILVAAALALTLCFALPALASGVPSAYELIYAVSPAIAQFFVPIQESCESDGIRMEVVSAFTEGDQAKVYVTMQDLTGDRVDGSIDLFDSYELNIPFDSTGHCEQVDFDAETKTATFLIDISTMHGEPIPGGKVTFSIGCFLSGKQALEDLPLTLDWSALQNAPETRTLENPSYGCEHVLKPGAVQTTFMEGFGVTALGFVDGKLHIQLHTPRRMDYDDHAFLTLTDAEGTALNGDLVYHDYEDPATGRRADYIDYVFPVSREVLQSCSLSGSFYTAASRTDGDWRVTFSLPTDAA